MNIDDLQNLVWFLENDGEISIGRLGGHRCAAIANDEEQMCAALVQRQGESIGDLLARLDGAIEDALEDQIFVDEINVT